ncbi:ATP-binding protein [Tamaricihabitans halophyticus]|uniref:ATP-binding protein n=1 Tax=Tamaricihabitans halophyticus TaxID=1262583 RepID=UPI001404B5D1|nr:ATP-binding protein [Tamaricihabitans halophyticus]
MSDLHIAIPARTEQLTPLRHALDEWAIQAGVSPADREALTLASYEAMTNVVLHAYSGTNGELTLHATRLTAEARVRVTVTDYGSWRSPARSDGQLAHGRGLPIMHAMASDTTIETTRLGTTVRMYWPCAGAGNV